MEPITLSQIAAAVNYIASLDFEGRSGLTEEIRANQPHAMMAMIELSHEGVETREFTHAFQIFRVIYTVFSTAAGGKFPLVMPENLDNARGVFLAVSVAIDRGSLSPQAYLDYHPEPHLLLWVSRYLSENVLPGAAKNNEVLLTTIHEILDAFVEVRATANSSIN